MERRITISVKHIFFFIIGIVVATSILVSSLARFAQQTDQTSASNTLSPSAQPTTEVLSATPLPSDSDLVLVTKVIDGDTIEIENGSRVRYIGIDTPETVDPRSAVQCFGKNASDYNRELVEGKRVRMEKDISETDRYGRLLRYVYVEDKMVNELLVSDGFAIASSYPPDIKYQENFNKLQTEARNAERGLWKECTSSTSLVSPEPRATTTKTQTINNEHPKNDCKIKGNITSEKIYHIPGGQFYDKTVIDESKGEKWFCSEAEAEAAGWRKSKV